MSKTYNGVCLNTATCKLFNKTIVVEKGAKCKECNKPLKVLGLANGAPMIKNADRDGRTRF